MPAMVWSVRRRRLSAILALGALGCMAAFGIRFVHRKPIAGTWLGHTYYSVHGRMVEDVTTGDFVIKLNKDGTYEENSNQTTGQWVQRGDVITLTPLRIFNKTPEEHRRRGLAKGKVSRAIEILLSSHMNPMVVTYNAFDDRLVYTESTLHFEYERMD